MVLRKWSAFYEYFVQSGVGVKYQAIPNLLEFELLYTDFWTGSDSKGAGADFQSWYSTDQTVNFRVVKKLISFLLYSLLSVIISLGSESSGYDCF